MKSKEDFFLSSIDTIKQWESQGVSRAEAAKRLNIRYLTFVRYLMKHDIVYKTNQSHKGIPGWKRWTADNIQECLESTLPNASKRQILIREGVKEEKCECCGLTEWNGCSIPLELHHKNFNHYDNRLENLIILCPNCHSTAHMSVTNKVHKHKPIKGVKMPFAKVCECCGLNFQTFNKKQRFCSEKCYHDSTSKMVSKNDLIMAFEHKKTFIGVAKYFNVGLSTIRRWVDKYGIRDMV